MLVAAELVVVRRIDRIGRGQVAGEGEDRHALVIGVFHRLVERGRVGAADDDGIDALVDELAHLLDLHRVLEVGLRDDDVLDQARSFFHFGMISFCRRSIAVARQVLPA